MERSKSQSSVKFIKKYIGRHGIAYIIGLAALFVVDFLCLFVPEYTGNIIDGLTNGTMDKEGLFLIIQKILFVGLGIMAMRFLWRYMIFGSCRKIEYEIRTDLYNHLSRQSVNFYNNNKVGDLMSYFTNDLSAIRSAVGSAVISTFDASVMTVMVLVKMCIYVDVRLTALTLIPMVLILCGGIKYGKETEKRFDEKQAAFSHMSDMVQESISGMRVIKAFVQEDAEFKAFDETNKYNKKMNLRIVSLMAVVMPMLDFLIGISSVLTLLYGGLLVSRGELTPGKFVAFTAYINMLVWPMLAMGDSITTFSQGIASMKRIGGLFKEVPEVKDTDETNYDIKELSGEIEIKNLSFAYRSELPQVLNNISLKIPKGESLAIIGRTGCGKTTIANLLLHMHNVPSGRIFFDGNDINTIPLETLREKIAYVPQDNFLFSDSVQTNIAFGSRDFKAQKRNKRIDTHVILNRKDTMEAILDRELAARESAADVLHDDLDDVITAAKNAEIHDNIMDFPKNYATMVGERGVTMSGGQKQRTSIARALMKDSEILILDDALSAVDTDTEERILEHLKEVRKNKTTIIIAHRISTIEHCDKIAVMEDGRIKEYGSHKELMELNGEYAALYEKQQLDDGKQECE